MITKKSKYTYLLNDQEIKIDLTLFHFDKADGLDNYLILFKPFIVMIYNGEVTLVSHIKFNAATGIDTWFEQITGKEIPKESIDPKLKSKLYIDISLD